MENKKNEPARQGLTRGDMDSIKKTMDKIHKDEVKKPKQSNKNDPFIEVSK